MVLWSCDRGRSSHGGAYLLGSDPRHDDTSRRSGCTRWTCSVPTHIATWRERERARVGGRESERATERQRERESKMKMMVGHSPSSTPGTLHPSGPLLAQISMLGHPAHLGHLPTLHTRHPPPVGPSPRSKLHAGPPSTPRALSSPQENAQHSSGQRHRSTEQAHTHSARMVGSNVATPSLRIVLWHAQGAAQRAGEGAAVGVQPLTL